MSDHVVGLLAGTIGAIAALLGVALSPILEGWRERGRANRERNQATLERTRSLYVAGIAMLETAVDRNGYGDAAGVAKFSRYQAKLVFLSTDTIVEQWDAALDALNAWAREVRQANPESVGDMIIVKHDSNYKAHREAALERYDEFREEREKLIKKMMAHLKAMENG